MARLSQVPLGFDVGQARIPVHDPGNVINGATEVARDDGYVADPLTNELVKASKDQPAYGPRWREVELTAAQVLTQDPQYQFVRLLAGALSTDPQQLYEPESLRNETEYQKELHATLRDERARLLVPATDKAAQLTALQQKRLILHKQLRSLQQVAADTRIMAALAEPLITMAGTDPNAPPTGLPLVLYQLEQLTFVFYGIGHQTDARQRQLLAADTGILQQRLQEWFSPDIEESIFHNTRATAVLNSIRQRINVGRYNTPALLQQAAAMLSFYLVFRNDMAGGYTDLRYVAATSAPAVPAFQVLARPAGATDPALQSLSLHALGTAVRVFNTATALKVRHAALWTPGVGLHPSNVLEAGAVPVAIDRLNTDKALTAATTELSFGTQALVDSFNPVAGEKVPTWNAYITSIEDANRWLRVSDARPIQLSGMMDIRALEAFTLAVAGFTATINMETPAKFLIRARGLVYPKLQALYMGVTALLFRRTTWQTLIGATRAAAKMVIDALTLQAVDVDTGNRTAVATIGAVRVEETAHYPDIKISVSVATPVGPVAAGIHSIVMIDPPMPWRQAMLAADKQLLPCMALMQAWLLHTIDDDILFKVLYEDFFEDLVPAPVDMHTAIVKAAASWFNDYEAPVEKSADPTKLTEADYTLVVIFNTLEYRPNIWAELLASVAICSMYVLGEFSAYTRQFLRTLGHLPPPAQDQNETIVYKQLQLAAADTAMNGAFYQPPTTALKGTWWDAASKRYAWLSGNTVHLVHLMNALERAQPLDFALQASGDTNVLSPYDLKGLEEQWLAATGIPRVLLTRVLPAPLQYALDVTIVSKVLGAGKVDEYRARLAEMDAAMQAGQREYETLVAGIETDIAKHMDHLRQMHRPPRDWQTRPQVSGEIALNAEVVLHLEEAVSVMHEHCAGLRDVTLDALSRTIPVDSGLPGAFVRLVAALIAQGRITHPTQYASSMQHRNAIIQRQRAVVALQAYAYNARSGAVTRRPASGGGVARTATMPPGYYIL